MATAPAIVSERRIGAPPEVVHALLCDVDAWAVWSPHIAQVRPAHGTAQPGARFAVRAWFSPRPVDMVVDAADPGRGLRWHSSAAGHTLRYENAVEADGAAASRVRFSARIEGPLSAALTALARPLSALGQRRRLGRLDALARFAAADRS